MDTTQEKNNIDIFNKVQKEQGTGKEFFAGQGVLPSNPVTTAIADTNTPVINKDLLSSKASPYVLPESKPISPAGGIIDEISSLTESQKKLSQERQARDLETKRLKDEQALKMKDFESIYKDLGLMGEKTLQAEEKAGLSDLQAQEDEYTSQIEAKTLSARRKIEQIQKQGTGGTLEGQRDLINKIEADTAREVADISIAQAVVSRRLDRAQSLIARKVELETEGLKTRADFLKFVIDNNKDKIDKNEERELTRLSKEADREYEDEKEKKTTLEETKLEILKSASEQGASSEVLNAIQQAKTPEEVYIKAGEFSGNIVDRQIKQATLKKLQADAKKAMGELGEAKQGPLAKAQAQNNINLITGLASDKYLNSAVGPNTIARTSFVKNAFTGGKNNFIAGVEQLRSQLTLDSLVNAKARGATFGALSEGELKTLQASGSKLATWAIKDKDGNITGYNASEVDFKRELDKINNFAKLDYLIKGGSPEDVGAKQMEDGSIWVLNSDGTYTQLN